MITIKAEGLQDGLYNIKNGKIFKYRAKGGTVRTYEMGEVVTCKECKHLYKDGECPLRTWFTHTEDDYCSYGERREDASTIEPKRKKGQWLEKHHAYSDEESVIEEWQSCRCSECGRYDTRPYMYYFSEPNYCSYCGADMRGEQR